MSLQIVQVRDDLLGILGYQDASDAPDLALLDTVIAINGAMQILQTAGQDYFTRQLLTLTLGAGTAAYVITQSVQSIIGPVRLNNLVPLRGLASRGEYDQFDRIFLGDDSYGAALGTPVAYWPEYLRSGTSGDIVSVTIYLAPIPSAAGSLVVEVVNDAPSYEVANLDDTTVLPIAQNYTESVFLPIARLLVTRSSLFSRPDVLESLTESYQRAMSDLGLSGGFPVSEQAARPRKTIG